MIITFAEHGKMAVSVELQKKIREVTEENMDSESTTFYCGDYGAFDHACAQIVRDMKQDYSNITSLFITPYINTPKLSNITKTNLYDGALYPNLENVPPRFAISRRKQFMVKQAHFVICYIKFHHGGAYKTLLYAKQKKKRIINLANDD